MANTKLPSRLLDTSAIPALNVTGDLTVDTTTLKVDSTNNRVGVGIASPKSTLNIAANNSGQGPILTLENTDTSITTGDVIGQIDFYANDGSTNGTGAKVNIKAVADSGAGTVTELTFGTSPSSSATAIERLRIDASGNVGIGTSSPSALLHLKSTTASVGPSLIFENTNNAQSMNIDYWNNAGAVQSRIQYAEGPAAWDFIPNVSSDSALHIAYDRTVGIGHTSPKSKLSIVGDGSLNTYSGVIGIENTAQDKWGSITLTDDIDTASASSNYYLIGRGSTYADRYMSFHVPTAANYGSGSQPKFVFASTGSDELFTLEASTGDAYHKGKVGIGTSTPHGLLQFDNSLNTRKIVLYEGFDNDYQFYGFGVEGSTLVYSTYTNTDDHVFFTGASSTSRTELMRIEGNGKVAIGSTTATSGYSASHLLTLQRIDDDPIQIRAGTTGQGQPSEGTGISWTWSDSSTNAATWAAIRAIFPGNSDSMLTFSTKPTGASGSVTERMRIDNSGRVTMPYQPGFKIAWGTKNSTGSGRILSTDAGDSVVSGRDQHNTGNHFSTSTGRFTAPVAGTYLLGFQAMRNGSNGTALECRIKKNGAYMWARAYQSAFDQNHQYWSIVTTTKCAVGDYFQVYIGPDTSVYNDDTYFYGHLLG